MNKLFITSAAITALFVAPAFGMEIQNTDTVDHDVVLGFPASPTSMDIVTIKAGKTAKGLCSDICTVSVSGSSDQDVAAVFSTKAVIKNGHIETKN